LLTPITLNGSGNDTLIVNDQGSSSGHFYEIGPTEVDRDFGAVRIIYSGMAFLQVKQSPITPFFTFPPLAKHLALPRSVKVGQLATLTGVLDEKARHDGLKLTVDWGDRSVPDVSMPGRAPFRRTHHYTKPGTYTVRVFWTDTRTSETNFRDLRLTVMAAKPSVVPVHHTRGRRVTAPRR
jgi:hypothetical protein